MPFYEKPTPHEDPSRFDTQVSLIVEAFGAPVDEGFRDDLCTILEQEGLTLEVGAEHPLQNSDGVTFATIQIHVDRAVDALMHAVRAASPRGVLFDFRLVVGWTLDHEDEDGDDTDHQMVSLVTEPVPGLL